MPNDPRTSIRPRGARSGCRAALLTACLVTAAALQAQTPPLGELSLEELMQVEVRLVSRHPQAAVDSPAALYVLTGDDLRRSGAITLPDALRLVPGMQVARIDASKWAVTARGFNDLFANKLLVLIDGRSVYNPLFSGVFWEAQEILLDDVERVEVVRGPGASMWGANAMNGVINVVTRRGDADTGGRIRLGAGTGAERALAQVTVYGAAPAGGRTRLGWSSFAGGDLPAATGVPGADDWWVQRGVVRADWGTRDGSSLLLEAQAYVGSAGQTFRYVTSFQQPAITSQASRSPLTGGYVLGRWRLAGPAGGERSLQVYYDYLRREDRPVQGSIHTADIEWQQRLAPAGRHDLLWGGGYRRYRDAFSGGLAFALEPPARTMHLLSLFAQDEVHLAGDDLRLSLGTRLEHNTFTGVEWQPNARLLWQPRPRHAAWVALARAVRTPSRVDADERFVGDVLPADSLFAGSPPAIVELMGGDRFAAESLVALDLGYRLQPAAGFAVDLSGFYNWYDDLRTSEIGLPYLHPDKPGYLLLPVRAANGEHGNARGVEVAVDVRPAAGWRLRGAYSYERLRLRHRDTDGIEPEAQPRHQAFARASWNPAPAWGADLALRFVGDPPRLQADRYLRADARLLWRPAPAWELTVGVRDLLAGDRLEQDATTYILHASKVTPSLNAGLAWNW